MTIKEIRQLSGLTQKAFSEKYEIPLSTIKKWEAASTVSNHRECPPYVEKLLERIVIEDIRFKTPNERKEICEIIVKRCHELRKLSFKEKHDRKAYMALKIRWQELQRLLKELGYEPKEEDFLDEYLGGIKC